MAKANTAKTKSTTKRATKKTTKKPTTVTKRVAAKKTRKAADQQFMETQLTQQTLYWVIFGIASIVFALWLFTLDAKVRDLYDQIDANRYNADPALNIGTDKPADAAEEAKTEE